MPTISFADFEKVDIRVGKIIDVQDFPEAHKPAYKLKIDFGEFGIKKSSARIMEFYSKKDLLGKQILAVTNFAPKQVANFISEVLVLGFVTDKGVILAQPERDAPLGAKMA